MSKTVAILQSNYIPWKGYFDLISRVDEFIIYDQVQYTKNDWRNRNRIKTAQGLQWLTIPVSVNALAQKIADTEVADPRWARKHWASIRQSYGKAPRFADYADALEAVYLQQAAPLRRLSEINRLFIQTINQWLGIDTRIRSSAEFGLEGDRNERLVNLCTATAATAYLSGPAARGYLDVDAFAERGIEVRWMDYAGYPEYEQPHGSFAHAVSIVDLLLCQGRNAGEYLKPHTSGAAPSVE